MQGSLQQLMMDMIAGLFTPTVCHENIAASSGMASLKYRIEDGYEGDPETEGDNSGYTYGCSESKDHESESDEDEDSHHSDQYGVDGIISSFQDTIAISDFSSMAADTAEKDGFCVDEDMTLDASLQDIEESSEYDQLIDRDEQLHNDKNDCSALGGCGCDGQQVTQEICYDYLDDESKRDTIGFAKVDCRKPRGMGAIEIALRTTDYKAPGHIFEPVLGMVFDSREEAFEFYNMYSWEVGFGIIYNHKRNSLTQRTMQEISCWKAGSDNRVNRRTKKTKCNAKIRLLRTSNGGWYITFFEKEHNHPLAVTCAEKKEPKSHRRLDEHTLETIKYLRQNNVRPTQIRCIVGSMFGTFEDAPCTKRSIRSVCSQLAREQLDNDVNKTVEIFKEMRAKDPRFQWSVELGENSSIKTLLWCSGRSREQYASFGDVLTFDTTYCTNIYKMPFGLFVGVNNHFQSIVFGGVLMKHETKESFCWIFKEFVRLMGGKQPRTVLTDMCKGMTLAVAEVWPGTFHIWCKWHVMKKIRESLGPLFKKNLAFRDEFYSVVNDMLTKQEFRKAWKDLCTRYDLLHNPFMIRTYQCKEKWAKAWCKGNFCAGMTSTQRSESANMMLKRFVPRNSSMNHFVSQFDLLLRDRDMEEGRQESQTKQLVMKLDGMWPIERHAIKLYTKASFMLFRKQVMKASNYVVSGKGDGFYVISHNKLAKKPTWAKSHFNVYVDADQSKYTCECGFFEHIGILCCHSIRLMIRLDVADIPECHIVKRWTRDANDEVPDHLKTQPMADVAKQPITFRKRMLNKNGLEAINKGNIDMQTYTIVMKHFNAAVNEVDQLLLDRAAKKVSDALVATGTCEDVVGYCAQSEIEGVFGNRYGALGSSAAMSDTEILNIKAPLVNRARGRPRARRFVSASEHSKKFIERRSLERRHLTASPTVVNS